MEKIYEEKRKQQKQKQIKIDGTSALSFLVAIFALVSLVSFGVSGGLNTSYALNDVSELPASFTSSNGTHYYVNSDVDFQQGIELHYGQVGSAAKFPVYCLQQRQGFCNNKTYSKNASRTISDAGLLYLLANLYPNTTMTKNSGTLKEGKEADSYQFVTQAAIWYYLYKNGSIDSSTNNDPKIGELNDVTMILTENTLTPNTDNTIFQAASGKTLFDSFTTGGKTVKQHIDKAIAIKNKTAITFTVNKSDIKVSKDNDEKFYITSAITVNGKVEDSSIGTYKGYSVALASGSPDGAYITDESGNKKSSFNAGEKFKVYVPTASIKGTDATTVNISVTGNFEKYTGFYYSGGENCQQVTTVENVVDHPNTGADFAIAPDTSMSSAQTIYFIGLVVLLCGVGIIYANAKPSAQKQAQQEQ